MHPTNAYTNKIGGRLLRVQLDDQVDSDLEVDVFLGGHCNHLAGHGVLVAIQPLGSSNKCVIFLQLLEESIGNALLANSNNITGLDQVAGDVNAAAIDSEMTVVHQLASLTAGVSEAQTINNVVQTTLDGDQQVVTGLAGGSVCHLVVVTELLLQNAVDELDLLRAQTGQRCLPSGLR